MPKLKQPLTIVMKKHFIIWCLTSVLTQGIFAQQNKGAIDARQEKNRKYTQNLPDFESTLLLEENPDTTANASFGDFDGDGHLDILLVKGRHWPIIDRVLLGEYHR